jgi:hypothetical protein
MTTFCSNWRGASKAHAGGDGFAVLEYYRRQVEAMRAVQGARPEQYPVRESLSTGAVDKPVENP